MKAWAGCDTMPSLGGKRHSPETKSGQPSTPRCLLALNFSGRASRARTYELCLATSHSERECVQSESVVIAITRPPPSRPSMEPSQQVRLSDKLCQKWNTSGCSYPRCRSCKGNHPVVRCTNQGQAPGKQPVHVAGCPY